MTDDKYGKYKLSGTCGEKLGNHIKPSHFL